MSNTAYYMDGRQGGIFLSGAASASGKFRRIVFVQTTAMSDLQDASISGIANMEGKTIPAGVEIGGNFTFIQIASGALIAYYA